MENGKSELTKAISNILHFHFDFWYLTFEFSFALLIIAKNYGAEFREALLLPELGTLLNHLLSFDICNHSIRRGR